MDRIDLRQPDIAIEAAARIPARRFRRVVEADGELVDAAVAYGEEMAQWPPLALRMSKRVLQENQGADLPDALRYESYGLSLTRKAPNDARESRASFLEKRKGVYTGT